MTDQYLQSLDINSHERRRNAAARWQALADMGRAFLFFCAVAGLGWAVVHFLF